jgi:hypothetical protein
MIYEYIIKCAKEYEAWHKSVPKIIIGKNTLQEMVLKVPIFGMKNLDNVRRNQSGEISGYSYEIGQFEYGFYLESNMNIATENKAKTLSKQYMYITEKDINFGQ